MIRQSKWIYKKLYYFSYKEVSNFTVVILLLRVCGCLLIGQKIIGISAEVEGDVPNTWKENPHVYIYMGRKRKKLNIKRIMRKSIPNWMKESK